MSTLQSIQTRLILAFLVVAFFSLIGLIVMQAISGTRAAQDEINRQLTTVVSYKAEIIREWGNTLKAELGNVIVNDTSVAEIQEVVEGGKPNNQSKPSLIKTREVVRLQLMTVVSDSANFYELFLIDSHGIVILSTDKSTEGVSYAGTQFFLSSIGTPTLGRPKNAAGTIEFALVAAYPVVNERNVVVGILAGRARYDPLLKIFADETGLREKADTYLLDMSGRVITGSNRTILGQSVSALKSSLESHRSFEAQVFNYINNAEQPVTGSYIRLPELSSVLLVEQLSQEVQRTRSASLAVNLSVALSSVLIAIFIAAQATRSIAGPLTELVDISAQITRSAGRAARSLDPEDESQEMPPGPLADDADALNQLSGDWRNEIGVLAQGFEHMTRQVSGLIAGLNLKVNERTRDLEQRSRYLEASADVSRAATSILDLERLLAQAGELIRDRFDLYYVGLFLADTDGEWALLRAGTGEAGEAMLARAHRLRIEPTSMIGWCITNDQARIAQQAVEDEVRVVNPELPLTRSEAALPLRARGAVIGALTVQSAHTNAFDEASLQVLQTMADQLAVAIDNAVLFARSREALEAERRAYALSSRTEWDQWRTTSEGQARRGLTLRSDLHGTHPAVDDWTAEMQQAYAQVSPVVHAERLAVPIQVRGHVIGVMSAAAPGNTDSSSTGKGSPAPSPWTGNEIDFLKGIADQLGVALDAARLYSDSHKRAEHERLVDELTGRMRATLDIESVLETAAREMRDAFGLAEVEVRLGEPHPGESRQNDPQSEATQTPPFSSEPSGNGAHKA